MAPLRTESWREGDCSRRTGADTLPSHNTAGKGGRTA